MENQHTINALLRKRSEIAGKIEHYQTVLRQSIIDLDAIDSTLRLFVPDIELQDIRPKPFPPRNAAFRGEVSRIILNALRASQTPLTAQDIARTVMAERGLNAYDKKLVRLIGKRVGASLRHFRNKGILRSKQSNGPHLLWELAT